MSNPPPQGGWPRPILDSGTPRRTWSCGIPKPAYISLTRVAHSLPDRHPPSRPQPLHPTRESEKFMTPPLTTSSPYQFGRWLGARRHRRLRGSPDHVSSLSRPGTRPGIRPVIRNDLLEGEHLVSVSRCVSAAGIGFLVILCPPGSWAFLTVGLPASSRTPTGFPRFARSSNDRGGCPLYPGDDGAHPDRPRSPARACRITATRPCTPSQPSIHAGLCLTRHQPRVQAISPVRSSPRRWLPDGTGALGLSPELRTPPLRATHVGVGTGQLSTSLKHALRHQPNLQPRGFT